MEGSPLQLLARKTVTQVRAVDFRLHVTIRCCGVYFLTVLGGMLLLSDSNTTADQVFSSETPFWSRFLAQNVGWKSHPCVSEGLFHEAPALEALQHQTCLTGPLLPGKSRKGPLGNHLFHTETILACHQRAVTAPSTITLSPEEGKKLVTHTHTTYNTMYHRGLKIFHIFYLHIATLLLHMGHFKKLN